MNERIINLRYPKSFFNQLRSKKKRMEALTKGHITWEDFIYTNIIVKNEAEKIVEEA